MHCPGSDEDLGTAGKVNGVEKSAFPVRLDMRFSGVNVDSDDDDDDEEFEKVDEG
jgi:hypothetical protein